MTKLSNVFIHQRQLMDKFRVIELRNDPFIHQSVPVAIASFDGQKRLRSFGFFLAEEMAEASGELYSLHSEFLEGNLNPDPAEFKAELADVFTFCVELAILSNIEADHLTQGLGAEGNFGDIVAEYSPHPDFFEQADWSGEHYQQLFIAFNELKKKPWKQAPYPGDIIGYQVSMRNALIDIIEHICSIIGFDELIHQYNLKHRINEKRIQSGK